MMKVSSSKNSYSSKHITGPVVQVLFTLMLLFAASVGAQTPSDSAQNLPEGARVNKDKCLGYEMDYKKYPKPVIAKVQADMYQLYHQDAYWKHDAGLKGKPLNDGILGPITWSWMQRFCKSFALDINADVVSAFPGRADELAKFSAAFNDDAATLISKPFALWSVTHHSACDLDVQETLAHGSDEQLQALVRCYLESKPTGEGDQKQAAPLPETKKPAAPPAPYTLYVLKEDDFAKLAESSAAEKLIAKAIESLKGKEFASEELVKAEINNLLADLPPSDQGVVSSALFKQFNKYTRYEISDKVLNTLNQEGISDALFSALQALPQKRFNDKVALTSALNKLVDEVNQSEVKVADGANSSSASSEASQLQAVTPAPELIKTNRLALRIELLAETSYWFANNLMVDALPSRNRSIPSPILEVLRDLQDREYPEGQLLHLAAKNKIIAVGLCKQDKSNTVDKSAQKKGIDAIKSVLPAALAASITNNEPCSENFKTQFNNYYDNYLKNAIEAVYSKPMPAYQHQPILWSGASEKCGCVPEEIQTMAYGIFPYWKTTTEAQYYDFSTFSRTAYFGLTVTDTGKLQQIHSPGSDLLKDNNSEAKAFLREARRYGSKLDWVLEKEFSAAPQLDNEDALREFFVSLENEIVKLLQTPLTDVESRLRPILSLGLASQPLNGDGVTLYFKNYPKSPQATEQFTQFYQSLKARLQHLDDSRNQWRVAKDNTYVNIMLNKSAFLDTYGTFTRENLARLTKVNQLAEKNLAIVEVQERIRTLLVLIMEDPYYTALDEIYAVTTGTERNIIAPLMFSDYSDMDPPSTSEIKNVDERKKRLAYVHESFGGGAFWPMVQYEQSTDGKNYKEFNDYIGKHFSPGYTESFWNETLCAYRWWLIYAMNIWLILASIYLITLFYLFPHRCKDLPGFLRWLQHPLTVVATVVPPIVLWGYLLLVDATFNVVNFSSVLCLLLLALAIWAGVDAVKALQQKKPNRNLLQYQKMAATPMSNSAETASEEMDEDIDDNERA